MHIDVAHLWLQDEVKSNRLRVRRVKSQDYVADHWDEGDQQQNQQKACDIHGLHKCSREFEDRRCHGAVDRGIRASRSEQFSSAENVIGVNWWPCEAAATAAAASWLRSPTEGDQERQLGARRLAMLKRIVVDSNRSSHVEFLTKWFVASVRFGVDDGIVVVAAEDDATVSLITDVSMV